MSTTLLTDEEMEQIAEKGRAIYDEKLKSLLEPEYNGKIVAIHLDTGNYEVAGNSPTASRVLRSRHPSGMIMTTNIGLAEMDSLSRRMMGGHPMTRQIA